jgi:hypothetical protein
VAEIFVSIFLAHTHPRTHSSAMRPNEPELERRRVVVAQAPTQQERLREALATLQVGFAFLGQQLSNDELEAVRVLLSEGPQALTQEQVVAAHRFKDLVCGKIVQLANMREEYAARIST